MISCEECICLPVCINSMNATKGTQYGFGYYLHRNSWLEEKCSYYKEIVSGASTIESWNKFKRFMLMTKGLI